MRRSRPIAAPDIAEFLSLIQQGRLYEVEMWIKEGRRLRDPERPETDFSPLVAAVKTGFHSMMELLLRQKCWTQDEQDEAVYDVMSATRLDLVESASREWATGHGNRFLRYLPDDGPRPDGTVSPCRYRSGHRSAATRLLVRPMTPRRARCSASIGSSGKNSLHSCGAENEPPPGRCPRRSQDRALGI